MLQLDKYSFLQYEYKKVLGKIEVHISFYNNVIYTMTDIQYPNGITEDDIEAVLYDICNDMINTGKKVKQAINEHIDNSY